MKACTAAWLCWSLPVWQASVAAYTPQARWGQASTTVSNKLYIHGGKVDATNSYQYSSAPNINTLLSLDLSSSFPLDDPPWQILSGSDLSDASFGPAVAFHTITAFDSNAILLFGGDGGPPLAIETYADSAWLLTNLTGTPAWTHEPTGWANQPIRRIYHTASAVHGSVWIAGGSKADGSGLSFTTLYQYSPASPPSSPDTFNLFPSTLPELIGHASVLLSNGTLVIFGGYSPTQGSLVSLSQIWLVDPSGIVAVPVAGSLPSARRNFAAALLDGNRIVIHGGADASLQNTYSDGFVLNIGTMSWSVVDGLSNNLGPRHDHFAVGLGSQVLFGFGYGANGPAPASLAIFDTSSGTWVSAYSPSPTSTLNNPPGQPSPTTNPGVSSSESASATRTAPGGSDPGTSTNPPGVTGTTLSSGISQTQTSSGSAHSSSTNPSGTSTKSHPRSTSGSSPSSTPSQSSVPPPGGNESESGSNTRRTLIIALSATLVGLLFLLLCGIAAYFIIRSRAVDNRTRWSHTGDGRSLIFASGDDDDPEEAGAEKNRLPMAIMRGHGWEAPARRRSVNWGLLGRSSSDPLRGISRHERFDILADEDENEFGNVGTLGGVRREGSGGSARPRFMRSASGRSFGELVSDSVSSLRTAGAALGRSLTGGGRTSPVGREKPIAPMEDATLLSDEAIRAGAVDGAESMPGATAASVAAPMRLRGGMPSQASSYYRDPFFDGLDETPAERDAGFRTVASESEPGLGVPGSSTGPGTAAYVPPGGMPNIDSLFPVTSGSDSSHGISTTSQAGHSSGSGSSTLHAAALARARSNSSSTTHSPPVTLLSGAPNAPLRRSDSWWTRFSRTSLLGHGNEPASPTNSTRRRSFLLPSSSYAQPDSRYSMDFRDPQPPPVAALHAIQESGDTPDGSPESAQQADSTPSRAGSGGRFGAARRIASAYHLHGRSSSSIQTADSDMLERLGGGHMAVVQRVQTASTHTHSASDTASESSFQRSVIVGRPSEHGEMTVAEGERSPALVGPRPPPPSSRNSKLKISSANVASRVAAYEQRSAMASPTEERLPGGPRLPPPRSVTAAERKEQRQAVKAGDASRSDGVRGASSSAPTHVRWGLAERTPLYVVNPDKRRTGSGDTENSPDHQGRSV